MGCDGRCGVRWGHSRRTKTLTAYGEIVWSWRRDPGVTLARSIALTTGTRKAASPGRARISRKTIARGKPGCLGCTCLIRVRSFATIAHGAAGAVSAWLSLRPLFQRADALHNPGKTAPRERGCLIPRITPYPRRSLILDGPCRYLARTRSRPKCRRPREKTTHMGPLKGIKVIDMTTVLMGPF